MLWALLSINLASCETIKDHDLRHYCRATTSHNASWCSFIKEQDIRQMCYAMVEISKKK